MGLELGMALKFYNSVVKELKLKVRKFWELITIFAKVTGETLVGVWGGGGDFLSLPILNRVKPKTWNISNKTEIKSRAG